MTTPIGQFTARYIIQRECPHHHSHPAGSAVVIVAEQDGEEVRYRTQDGSPVVKIGDGSYQINNVIPPIDISSDDPDRI